MQRKKSLAAIGLAACFLTQADPVSAARPRDDFFNPQPPGLRLKLFGFFGPGFRGILEHRQPIEEDMSELHTQLLGDVNYGYSEGSLNTDLRIFLFSFGLGAGLRNDWHVLRFKAADAVRYESDQLDVKTRWQKDHQFDWESDVWPWYEGRVRVIAPMYQFIGISTTQFRYQAREFDNGYDWQYSTVFDRGFLVVNESFLVLRGRTWGFIGPAVRVLNVPRGAGTDDERRETDFHYGILAGTQAGPRNRDTILLRIYTTAGINDDLMGTHAYRAPLQVLLGYQADFALWEPKR